jgi:hypothetical protein
MNMELRTQVLSYSLKLEDFLSSILAILFRFPKDGSKTLGNTSYALSFKTKADLLKDLDRIPNNTYQDLITFMEIRNQLIHNLSTTSMFSAIQRNNKLNKLLSLRTEFKGEYNSLESEYLKETFLRKCFMVMCGDIINQLKEIAFVIEKEINEEQQNKKRLMEADFFDKATRYFSTAIDEFSDVFDAQMDGQSEFASNKGLIKRGIWFHFLKNLKGAEPEVFEQLKNIKL